jgi:hypothetical protein
MTTWTEIDEENFDYMLGTLPPAAMTGLGFLAGEPFDHDRNGRPRFSAYAKIGDRFFAADHVITVAEFKMLTPADIASAVATG